MKEIENLHALKREIADIFMHLAVDEHEQRKQQAAVRYLKARRGIEQRAEKRQLAEEIAELPD